MKLLFMTSVALTTPKLADRCFRVGAPNTARCSWPKSSIPAQAAFRPIRIACSDAEPLGKLGELWVGRSYCATPFFEANCCAIW
jgi:hypothetical protein